MALGFVVTGLSHIVSPGAWVRFFLDMRARGPEIAGLLNAYVALIALAGLARARVGP